MFKVDSSTLLVETLIEDQCKEVDTNCELYCNLETDGCLNVLIKTSTIKSMVKTLKNLRQVSQVDIIDDNAIQVYVYNAL